MFKESYFIFLVIKDATLQQTDSENNEYRIIFSFPVEKKNL